MEQVSRTHRILHAAPLSQIVNLRQLVRGERYSQRSRLPRHKTFHHGRSPLQSSLFCSLQKLLGEPLPIRIPPLRPFSFDVRQLSRIPLTSNVRSTGYGATPLSNICSALCMRHAE